MKNENLTLMKMFFICSVFEAVGL